MTLKSSARVHSLSFRTKHAYGCVYLSKPGDHGTTILRKKQENHGTWIIWKKGPQMYRASREWLVENWKRGFAMILKNIDSAGETCTVGERWAIAKKHSPCKNAKSNKKLLESSWNGSADTKRGFRQCCISLYFPPPLGIWHVFLSCGWGIWHGWGKMSNSPVSPAPPLLVENINMCITKTYTQN